MSASRFRATFRAPFEWQAIGAWIVAALLLGLVSHVSPLPSWVYQATMAGCMVVALAHVPSLMINIRRRRRLKGQPLSFISIPELVKIVERNPGKIWFGKGFVWSKEKAQLVHEVTREDPNLVAPPKDGDMGQRWIHGLGDEQDIFFPVEHNQGHLLLPGTTGAGKTRTLDLLISQAIIRGECVIIIDPKGDRDLADAARNTCVALGQPERFVYFHPAFPEQSVCIDPLRNFNRATELATRIAALLAGGGTDPFVSFGQMSLSNLTAGCLLINEKPSLIQFRRYLEGGAEGLVVKASHAWFDRRLPSWEEALRPYVSKAKGNEAIACIQFYRDNVQELPGGASSELEGLYGMFEHDRSHFGKMITSLMPLLNMLTSGSLGRLLSPDPSDFTDTRRITDFSRVIKNKQVLYIGLDALSDVMVGQAIGSLMLSDLTSVAGDIYNYAQTIQPVNLYIDEAAEVINDPFIAQLNKGRGAGVRCTVATQTFSDFASRVGSRDKAGMILGNINNSCVLRVLDKGTQEYITETMPETMVRHIEYQSGVRYGTDTGVGYASSPGESLRETMQPMVPAPILGCLPNLEFFLKVSAGRIYKGRTPILNKELPEAA